MGMTEQGSPRNELKRNAIGTAGIVFFVVAAAAPLAATLGASPLVFGSTGVGGPGAYLAAMVVLLLFAVGYATMSRHVTSAGGFAAYISRGLGRPWGFAAAFVALLAYNAMQIGIYGLFGVAMGAFMADKIGIALDWYWWCVIAGAVIGMLGVLQIDLNARVLAVLLIGEVIVVALFDFAVVADPGPQGLTTVAFDPTVAFGSAVGATLTFCVASFVGFESAAIYSEECRDPKRTVARATFIAVGLIAVFYALSSWLLGVAAGPDTMISPDKLVAAGFTSGNGPDPTTVLFITGQDRLGAFWGDAASLLFATSLFAALLSFHNAVARYAFALGREGVLPSTFGRVNPRTGAPWIASLTQTVLALTVVLVFAIAGADPVLKLFTWLTNLGALGVLALMAATSFAVVGYFRRRPEAGLTAWSSQIAPAVAGVLLVVILVLGVLNFNVLITSATDAPTDTMTIVLPLILLIGGVLGLAVGAWLKRNKPETYARIGEGRE
jgi:amino acid transporter